jgi:hypothetical protein
LDVTEVQRFFFVASPIELTAAAAAFMAWAAAEKDVQVQSVKATVVVDAFEMH